MKIEVTFYGADEVCGGQQVEEPTFSVSLGEDNRLITMHEVCEGDESTLKDLTGYAEHSARLWNTLNAEIEAWDEGRPSPLELEALRADRLSAAALKVNEASDLDALLEALLEAETLASEYELKLQDFVDTSELPTFGEFSGDTFEVFSWDATRLLIQENPWALTQRLPNY
jgi:hypothetical protein